MTFNFINNPTDTIDLLYNLLLMDSIAAFAFLGYRVMKKVFARMRTFRNWKGDK